MSRFQFVADNSATFEVKRLCELVEIERSSYYAWLKAAPAREARAADDAALAERIRAVHAEDNTQGAPRITLADRAACQRPPGIDEGPFGHPAAIAAVHLADQLHR